MASILVVCTGNVCRSPMAEGFLLRLLGQRRLRAGIQVSSVGIAGLRGSGPMPESIAAAAERGADISQHVARRLDPRDVRKADLVLTMTGGHRDRVLDMVPEAAAQTFTLKELVRLLEALPSPASPGPPGDRLRARVRQAADLRRTGFEGNPHDEDVADPMGMPQQTYDAVAWEIDEWCSRLVEGLFAEEGTAELEWAPTGRIPAAPPRPDALPGA
ncbi:MAG: protein-tyrosine-phosphatase [Actinomycetota bacterium]|nr:protein-tyrosine-phosphatase [Actinomycetota bacterium]